MRAIPFLAKLDRVFIFDEWDKFGLATAYSVRRPTSDHVPIYLSLEENCKKSKIFRFEKWWLQQ